MMRFARAFLETYEAIVNGETADWRRSAKGRLAEIIVLDQFSRNMLGMMLERLLQMH